MLVCSLDWEVVTERRRVNFLIQTARGAAVRAEWNAKNYPIAINFDRYYDFTESFKREW